MSWRLVQYTGVLQFFNIHEKEGEKKLLLGKANVTSSENREKVTRQESYMQYERVTVECTTAMDKIKWEYHIGRTLLQNDR